MKRKSLLLAVGGLAFVLFVLARIPASVAVQRLPPGLVAISGLQGTIWGGTASRLQAQGLTLERTQWSFHFLSLLRAEIGYQFQTRLAGEPLQGVIASGRDGQVRLSNVEGRVDLQSLAALLPTGFFSGSVVVNADEVVLSNYWPVAIDARFTVERLAALTTRPATLLGNFEIVFDQQDQPPLAANLRDLEGSLGLEGQLTLAADRRFTLDAQVAAHDGAPPAITNMLDLLGAADKQGRRRLQHTGRM